MNDHFIPSLTQRGANISIDGGKISPQRLAGILEHCKNHGVRLEIRNAQAYDLATLAGASDKLGSNLTLSFD